MLWEGSVSEREKASKGDKGVGGENRTKREREHQRARQFILIAIKTNAHTHRAVICFHNGVMYLYQDELIWRYAM